MAETGVLLEVRWEWDGTELAAAALLGATTVNVVDPFAISADDVIWFGDVAAENAYSVVSVNTETGDVVVAPALLADFDEGTPVVPDVGGRPGQVWVAEVMLPDGDEPIEVPLTVHDLSVIPEQTYDPPIAITLSDDLRSVIDLPGSIPSISGAYIPPDSIPSPVPSDPPAVSPVPEVFGTVDSLVITTDPNLVDPGTMLEYHISTDEFFVPVPETMVIESPSNVVVVNTLPDGTPLALNTQYYVIVIAKNVVDAAPPSATVPGALDPDRVSQVIAAEIVAGFILAGNITVGNITIDPVNGIVISVPGGSIRLPADGVTPASFDGEVTARKLSVIDNYTISGNGQLNGTFILKSGINAPGIGPNLYYDWVNMKCGHAELCKGLTPVLPGVPLNNSAGDVPDPEKLMTAVNFFGAGLRVLDQRTGDLGWYPDPSSEWESNNWDFEDPTPTVWDWWLNADTSDGQSLPEAVKVTTTPFAGTYCLRQIATATGVLGAQSITRRMNTTPNQNYTFSPYVRHTISRETQAAQLQIAWYDNVGAQIGSTITGTATTVPITAWKKMPTLSAVAPTGAVTGEFRVVWNPLFGPSVAWNQQVGDTVYYDNYSAKKEIPWGDAFYPLGGLCADTTRNLYWIYGSDSNRSGDFYWYAIRGDTMQKVGEKRHTGISSFPSNTYPRIAVNGNNIYTMYYDTSNNLKIVSQTLTGTTPFAMPTMGALVNSATIHTSATRPEIGMFTVGPFDGSGTVLFAYALRTGTGIVSVRSLAAPTVANTAAGIAGLANFLRAGSEIIDGGTWHPTPGRFVSINASSGVGRMWLYSDRKMNTTIRAAHTWYDPKDAGVNDWLENGLGDGSDATHETTIGPYTEFLVQCRSWFNVEVPSPPDAEDTSGNRNIADASRLYIGEGAGTKYRYATLGRSIRTVPVSLYPSPLFDIINGPNRMGAPTWGTFNYFTPDDVGATVTGTYIPPGTTIIGLDNDRAGQVAILSNNHTPPFGLIDNVTITRTALGRKLYQHGGPLLVAGNQAPLVNGFDLVAAIPGVIRSTLVTGGIPTINLLGDGSGRAGPMQWNALGDLLVQPMHIGGILLSAAGAVPPTFLDCNGQAVSRTTYASLFTAIGTTYGVGDGSTTFNVPDLIRRLPVGRGGGISLGRNEGIATASASTRTFAHNHTHSHTHSVAGQDGGTAVTGGSGGATSARFSSYNGHAHGGDTGGASPSATSNSSFDDIPTLCLAYYIKALPY